MKRTIKLTESALRGMIQEAVNGAMTQRKMRKSNPNRLTEDRLRAVIQESVKRVLNEGGHLFIQNDDGSVYTNSKQTYRGVPGSKFIWHGEWSDPEILWDGELINYNEFEENLWYKFKSETGEDSEEAFEQWIEQEGGTKFIAAELDDYLMCLNN